MKEKKKIKIGKYYIKNNRKRNYYLNLKDLENNVLISGTTNTGKKIVSQKILLDSHQIPFLLITMNNDFDIIKESLEDILILKPGKNFSINILNSYRLKPCIYAQAIIKCLKNCNILESDISPFSEYTLGRILEKIYKNQNLQNFNSFNHICTNFLNQKDKTTSMENVIEDVRNAMKYFFTGNLKKVCIKNNRFDVKELFSKNIILDLSSILDLGGNIKDIIIFLCILFRHIKDLKIVRSFTINERNIDHFTILDNAQKFRLDEMVHKNIIIEYWEEFAFYLRRRGECLLTITTEPIISKDALCNNGVIIAFQHSIKNPMLLEALNFKNGNEKSITSLHYGEFFIKTNSFPYPSLLNI